MVDVLTPTAHRLQHVLATEQAHGRVPSLAAAVVRDGAVVWRGHCGVATGSTEEPGPDPTLLQYRIGSITKTLTAVMVLRLRDQGLLSLEDPLAAHLPEAPHGDLRLHSLLAHDSGLVAEPPGEWWERVPGGTFADLVQALGDAAAPFAPGVTHHYSNVAFGLLGEVVARVGTRPWRELVADQVLAPLGMHRTSYVPEAPHAQGYSVAPWSPLLSREPAADTGAMAPAGQLWSTVEDLARFAAFLVAGHEEVLARDTLQEMSTPQSGTLEDGLASGYGLGLRLLAGGSGLLVGHTGSMPGFQASLFVDRPRRACAVVLGNSTAGIRTEQVAPALLDVLEACEPALPEPWLPVTSVPAPVAELLGVWHWGNTPRLFTWDGARLRAVHALTGAREETWRLVGDTLVGASGYHHGEPIEVVRAPGGGISHLRLSTFVLTRSAYDPEVPAPGGHPATGPG